VIANAAVSTHRRVKEFVVILWPPQS
jgi:hypothetical protein